MAYTKTSFALFKTNPKKQGRLYLISGPSGVGKTTIIEKLLEKAPNLEKIVAFTTRAMRPGEIPGHTYHYISKDEFAKTMQQNDFLIHFQFTDNAYGFGLSEKELMNKLNAGIDLIV